jgi:hypothetical protein
MIQGIPSMNDQTISDHLIILATTNHNNKRLRVPLIYDDVIFINSLLEGVTSTITFPRMTEKHNGNDNNNNHNSDGLVLLLDEL